MLKKYSVLVVSVALMASAFGLGGCVAQTAETDEVTEGLTGSLPGESNLSAGTDGSGRGAGVGKNGRQAPLVVRFNPKSDPAFNPILQVSGNPEPQPWTEPKHGPVSDGH